MQKKIFYLFFLLSPCLFAQKTFYTHFGTNECLNEVWDAIELKNQIAILALNKSNCNQVSADNGSEILMLNADGKISSLKKFKYDADEKESIGGIHLLADSSYLVTSKIINVNSNTCEIALYHFDKKFKLIDQKRNEVLAIEDVFIFKSHYDAVIKTVYFSFNDENAEAYVGSIKEDLTDFKTLKIIGFSLILEVNLNHNKDKYIGIFNDTYVIDTTLKSFSIVSSNTSDDDISAIKKIGNKFITMSSESSNYPPQFGVKESNNISCKILDKNFKVIKYASMGKPHGVKDTLEAESFRGLDWQNLNKIYLGWTTLEDYEFGDIAEELNSWLSLAQLDSNLNVKWTRYYFGQKFNATIGIIATTDSGVLMYGRQSFDGVYSDGFVFKVKEDGSLTSDKTPELADFEVSINPNPCRDYFSIAIGQNGSVENFELFIYDTIGRLVKKENIASGINKIDVSEMSNNLYLYVLKNKNQIVKQGKIVKQ